MEEKIKTARNRTSALIPAMNRPEKHSLIGMLMD